MAAPPVIPYSHARMVGGFFSVISPPPRSGSARAQARAIPAGPSGASGSVVARPGRRDVVPTRDACEPTVTQAVEEAADPAREDKEHDQHAKATREDLPSDGQQVAEADPVRRADDRPERGGDPADDHVA